MRETGINRGGLYGFFVKGERLQGTISSTEENSAAESAAASNLTSGTSTPHTSGDVTPPTSTTDSAEDMADSSDAIVSKKRKRRSGEQADDDARKRRKEEKQEERKQKAEAKREKALADETPDLITEIEKKRAREPDRKASKLIKKAARQEELSPILLHPSMPQPQVNTRGEANGEAKESEEAVSSFGAMHADRMMMIQGGLRNQSRAMAGSKTPAKKLSCKTAKCEREKATRVKKREPKVRLRAEPQASGILANLKSDPREVQHEKQAEEGNAERKADGAKRETTGEKRREEKERQKRDRREGRKTRKPENSENQLRPADTRSDQCKVEEDAIDAQRSERNSDEIKLESGITGKKLKKVSSSESTEEQPSDVRRKQKELVVKQKHLTNEQRQQYAGRAAEKGMTIEAYLARRVEKKRRKSRENAKEKVEDKAQEFSNVITKPETNTLGSVIHTTGNTQVILKPKDGHER